MRIVLVGPGRAGMSLAVAATTAGNEVLAVVGRTAESAAAGAALIDSSPMTLADNLPAADLLIIATRDGAIASVAGALVDRATEIGGAVHVSGLTPVRVLEPLQAAGMQIGSFHPLQTLPTPESGAARLSGAFVGITAEPPLLGLLEGLAEDLGAVPFALDDDVKPLYHAAAAAAANFPLAALAMAADMFGQAGVPWEAARPLVEAVVGNAFELGPRAALTGPVARGDTATVAAQLAAVDAALPQWRVPFARFVEVLAALTGRAEQFDPVLNDEGDEP